MSDTHDDNQLLDQVTDQVLENIFLRVARDLTDDDLHHIEELDKHDPTGKKVKKFLLEIVPNMETIIFEEIQQLKKRAQH